MRNETGARKKPAIKWLTLPLSQLLIIIFVFIQIPFYSANAEDSFCHLGRVETYALNGSNVDYLENEDMRNRIIQNCAGFLALKTPTANKETISGNDVPVTVSWSQPRKTFKVGYDLYINNPHPEPDFNDTIYFDIYLSTYSVTRVSFADMAGVESQKTIVATNLNNTLTSFKDTIPLNNGLNSFQYIVSAQYVSKSGGKSISAETQTNRFQVDTSGNVSGSAAATNNVQPYLTKIPADQIKYDPQTKVLSISKVTWTTPKTTPTATPRFTLTVAKGSVSVFTKKTDTTSESDIIIKDQTITKGSSSKYVVYVKANYNVEAVDSGNSNPVTITVSVDGDGKATATTEQGATQSENDNGLAEANKQATDDKNSCAACERVAKEEGGLFMGGVYKLMCCMMVDFQNIVIKFFGWLTGLMLYFIQNV